MTTESNASEKLEKLQAAIRTALTHGRQPHYGDLFAAIDHYSESIEQIENALKESES